MREAAENCWRVAETYTVGLRYGAYITALERVVQAMQDRGW